MLILNTFEMLREQPKNSDLYFLIKFISKTFFLLPHFKAVKKTKYKKNLAIFKNNWYNIRKAKNGGIKT